MIKPRPNTMLPPGAMKAIDWNRTFSGPILRCNCASSLPGAGALLMLSLLFRHLPVHRVRHDDDLAERPPFLELCDRLGHARERVHPVNDGIHLAACDEPHDVEKLAACPAVGAEDVQLAPPDVAKVGRRVEPGGRPAGHDPPAVRRAADRARPGLLSRVVDDDVRTFLIRELPDRCTEVLLEHVDRVVRSQIAKPARLLARAGAR